MFNKRSSMKVWDAVKILTLFFIFESILTIVLTLVSIKLKITEDLLLISSISVVVALLLCIKKYNKKYYISFIDRFSARNCPKSIFPVLILTTIGFSIVISELVNYISLLFPMNEFLEEIFSKSLSGEENLVSTMIRVVLVASVVEEILIRGIILEGFLVEYSNFKSILLSALLFGIIHLNIYQFVAALIIGIFLGWLYVNTNSLLLCIISHGAFNSLGYIVGDILNIDISGYTTEGFQPFWFTGIGLILIILGIFLLKRIFIKKRYCFYY